MDDTFVTTSACAALWFAPASLQTHQGLQSQMNPVKCKFIVDAWPAAGIPHAVMVPINALHNVVFVSATYAVAA